jgi:thiol-disulfide isomerase/thioredoxin
MTRPSKHRVLISGIIAPIAAIVLYALVYTTLTTRSSNPEKDWLFRLAVSTAAMIVPFAFTLFLAIRDWRKRVLTLSGKVGLSIAILSLGLAAKPVSDGMTRWKQSRNEAMRDVAAPLFNTTDILGNAQRLADYRGKVVLVNIWATWCAPCRAEMPELEQLYRDHKDEGFVVLGLSDEDVATQTKFVNQVPVSYPLLTYKGDVPSLYRDIARYPAMFLIDRQGRLHPVPGPERPFVELAASAEALLGNPVTERRQ